ncbi:ornithine--oxo-acid transaminase [Gulosibacter molinativorax]|uniref:ornithine aminotransferase n=1 Tax=Gulosibacter molinativorax TaxID=256821 RepID=A0ABT7C6Q7_9MICO|nr:ornithine--oxo-acid transaminase [Gulosibacter molinativorax]MDJ1370710.1 ornithine--oxo-acid transaminase [Gulosibacter molinativorax]QUY63264.1 Ornithine aminotransferase [Gulosibacter molinativorax]
MNASVSPRVKDEIAKVKDHSANNYAPLELVIESAEGAWITDVDGKRYLDCLSAYSATTFGHAYPKFIEVLREQTSKISIASRAVYVEGFGDFAEALAKLAGKDMILAMNTGAEANETAIKIARKWGYRVKGVAEDKAKIIGMEGNFHGRTTTMISLSDDPIARKDYGPFTPGFELVPFNDAEAVRGAIDENTVAVIVEPIQGEAGVAVPDEGYLAKVREITQEHNVLLIVDEVQTGLGRTGTTFRFEADGIEPDLITVAKALGGGILPVSAVIGNKDVLGVLEPGTHGSTFGGNPLAAAIGKAVVDELATGKWQQHSQELHPALFEPIRALLGRGVTDVRGAGLWAGLDIDPKIGTAHDVCEDMLEKGILAKDTRAKTIRLAPPFIVTREEVDFITRTFTEVIDARWQAAQ